MIADIPGLADILDDELVGFITAVNPEGQPQTSPVWFVRSGEEIVIYNKPDTPRLDSIAANPKVAFNLRGDRRAGGAALIEGVARHDPDLATPQKFPGYLKKYEHEIERLGWTPDSFDIDYGAGIRVEVKRVRTWGLDKLRS